MEGVNEWENLRSIPNYLLTESEVITGKSKTGTLPYWPRDSKVNTAKSRFEIFPERPNVQG